MVTHSQDIFDLNRFVEAQSSTYVTALAELQAGKKCTHWSWFILPQIHGLGSSPMSVRYALSGLAEAREYLKHSLLGARLRETIETLLIHGELSAEEILGTVDAQKLRSCLTLFNLAAGDDELLFQKALDKFFTGLPDVATLALLEND